MGEKEFVSDNSFKNFRQVPNSVLQNGNLKMLYLDGNFIETLPENFFQLLPNLYWLDLRGNMLSIIPKGIANHMFLENLLLQNNGITELPNELGLVPNLKVLQLSGNPITYPSNSVVEAGTEDIVQYLKQQYELAHPPTPLHPESTELLTITTSNSSILTDDTSYSYNNDSSLKSESTLFEMMPVIKIKKLSNPQIDDNKKNPSGDLKRKGKKFHNINKTASKLSVHSHYNTDDCFEEVSTNREIKYQEEMVKRMWLDKLKDLLLDQEKIIQQEKTLQALSSWRREKRNELRSPDNTKRTEAPYDTEPEYNRLMSRRDLTKDIDRLIAAKKSTSSSVTADEIINDVISQLRSLNTTLSVDASPAERLRNTEREIQLIMELHKKIADVQKTIH